MKEVILRKKAKEELIRQNYPYWFVPRTRWGQEKEV